MMMVIQMLLSIISVGNAAPYEYHEDVVTDDTE